MTVFFQMWSC